MFAAEPGFDAHGLKLVPHDADLRDLLFVQRPGAVQPGDFFGSVMLEYSHEPLVAGPSGDTVLVDQLATAHLSLGAAFHERLRIDLLAPLHATSLTPGGREGPAMGDVRLGTMLLLLPPENVIGRGGGLGLGLTGHLSLPSGDTDRFLGQGVLTGGGRLAATWELTRVTFTADGGVDLGPTLDDPTLPSGPAVLGGVGMGVLVGRRGAFNLEGVVRRAVDPDARLAAEGVLSIRGQGTDGGFWMLGGAAGLPDSPATASFRGFFSFGFGSHELPKSADADSLGRLTVRDACPLEPETENGWKDDDGCPDELGELAVQVRYRERSWPATVELQGPIDRMTLEIGEEGYTMDATPESRWTATATAQCLGGSATAYADPDGSALTVDLAPVRDGSVFMVVISETGDLVSNGQVVWRSEMPACVPEGPLPLSGGTRTEAVGPGTHMLTVTADGFASGETEVSVVDGEQTEVEVILKPTRVRLEADRIVILDKVYFESAKATIKPESFRLLDEVAASIRTAPDVGRIEIAGHTDNEGTLAYNQRLSQSRAEAVRDYLYGKGVSLQRLIPVGYGESRPLATNRTETGKEQNRRVEFNLLDAPEEGR